MPTCIHEARKQLIRGTVDNIEDGRASDSLFSTRKKINKHMQRHEPLEVAHAAASGGLCHSLEIRPKLETKRFAGVHVWERPFGSSQWWQQQWLN